MRLVKCKNCGVQISNLKSFKIKYTTQKTNVTRHYCSEECYKKEQENKIYRTKNINTIYSFLNVKVKDNGALINKKLKEIDCYSMKQIYDVLDEDALDFNMFLPQDGDIYSRICYLFAMLKNKLINKHCDELNISKETSKKAIKSDDGDLNLEEECFVPMRKVKKNNKKIIKDIDLDF